MEVVPRATGARSCTASEATVPGSRDATPHVTWPEATFVGNEPLSPTYPNPAGKVRFIHPTAAPPPVFRRMTSSVRSEPGTTWREAGARPIDAAGAWRSTEAARVAGASESPFPSVAVHR